MKNAIFFAPGGIHTNTISRCVFAEMKKGRPILTGNSDTHQIELIFQLCGSPNERNMPGWERLPDARLVKTFGNHTRTLEAQFNMWVTK